MDALLDTHLERFNIGARLWGPVAARVIGAGGKGRVSAVFERGFYIEFAGGIAFVCGAECAPSPLNVTTAAPPGTNWRASGLRLDDKVFVTRDRIRVGRHFRFDLRDVQAWTPDPIPVTWSSEDLQRGLDAFRHASQGRIPAEGLGGFVLEPAGDAMDQPIQRRAFRPIQTLERELVRSFRASIGDMEISPDVVAPILGLGPGLTPSGDDFIGGMMIASRSLGGGETSDRLWRACQPLNAVTGNAITLAHLSAAAEGLGSIGIHCALFEIAEGRRTDFRAVLPGIDAIGQTSGWDAMAGVVRLLDCWLKARLG
ncbi:MAG: DUF2877 domain-containing protein [Alphaproteobacteria bacterium]|nr:DUF2877 domain-containing protein [Alphaproteobacteria bacterium]